jgi:hypothetical protein
MVGARPFGPCAASPARATIASRDNVAHGRGLIDMRRTIRSVATGGLAAFLLLTLVTPAVAEAQITGFTPASGPIGTVVTITGNGLTGSTAVFLDGDPMPFTVNSDTQITATVATGATSGKWSVATPSDKRWSQTEFTVTASTLSISGFAPASGPIGTVVTITGVGFSGTTNVYLDGRKMPFTVNSDTQITATVAAGAKSGKWSVERSDKRVWSSKEFTVTSGSPDITGFSPMSGPVGTIVTIRGAGFTGSTAVYLDGEAMPFTVNSDTQITATVASGAETGLWSVQTPSKRVWSDQRFKVTSTTHARSVSLSLSGHVKASGRVSTVDGYDACSGNVPVVIKRYHHGRWHHVITVSTGDEGRYHAPLRDVNGKYVARAREIQLVNGETCLHDRSARHWYAG